MAHSMKDFRTFEDALAVSDHGLPYQFARIFRKQSWADKRLSRTKLKVLQEFEPVLAKALHPGETVYFLTFGIRNSAFEQMFLGWVAYMLNRRLFVFTTHRVLIFQYRNNWKPGVLTAELPYVNIVTAKGTLFGGLRLKLGNRESMVFSGVPGADRKAVVEILNALREKLAAPEESGGIVNLCPHCFTSVEGFPAECAACHGKFKSARKAALLSLAFPGLGDLYLGHGGFAVLEMIGTAFAWFILVVSPFIDGGEETTAIFMAIMIVFLFLFVHCIDAAVTYAIGRKGIYPAK